MSESVPFIFILHCASCGLHGKLEVYTETYACPTCGGEMQLAEIKVVGNEDEVSRYLELLSAAGRDGNRSAEKQLIFLSTSPEFRVRKMLEKGGGGSFSSYTQSLVSLLAEMEPTDESAAASSPEEPLIPVRLRSIVESPEWGDSKAEIPVILGENSDGEPVVIDLSSASDIMLCGFSGTGKSVCLNVLILSLLLRFRPDELRLIMIDPSGLELSFYQGVPHLLAPVIADLSLAVLALRWVVREMERRCQYLSRVAARNIQDYNRSPKVERTVSADESGALPDKLPILVVCIDGLADLLASDTEDELSALVMRLTGYGDKLGIHLIATCRYLNKKEVPELLVYQFQTHLAFKMSSRKESRAFINQNGAETLSGRGEMLLLHLNGSDQPLLIQGAMAENDEIQRIVEAISKFPSVPLNCFF